MVSGYVSSVSYTDSDDANFPLCAQVVMKLPFRLGEASDETEDSWAYARANAYASEACLPMSYQVLRAGSIVRGVVGKSHDAEDKDTPQLALMSAIPLFLSIFPSYQVKLASPMTLH